jgi:hypothetical protein
MNMTNQGVNGTESIAMPEIDTFQRVKKEKTGCVCINMRK